MSVTIPQNKQNPILGPAQFKFFGPCLVAELPAATSALIGCRAVITDGTGNYTAGIGAAPTGGNATVLPVFCDGGAWRIG